METRERMRLPDWAVRVRPTARHERRPVIERFPFLRLFINVPEAATLLATVALFVSLWLSAPQFATLDNLLSVGQQVAFIGIVATGMTFLLIAGELDLSVGSAYGFTSIFLAWLVIDHGWSLGLAIPATLLMGAGIGFFNGTMTTRFRVPSFIVTLGMLGVLRGLALALSGGLPIGVVESNWFNQASTGLVFGNHVPAQVFWLAGVMILGAIVLAHTRFGYHVYATGGNRKAAANSGIKTARIKLYTFVITGTLVALVGVLAVGWLGSANPLTGDGFELQVIAAAVIGGTSLFGGAGSIFGTFLGAAVIGMLSNGLVLLGVDQYWQQFATGAIIVGAALLNVSIRRVALQGDA
jgi:ribose transport system permease protein